MAPLHRITPLRLHYIRTKLASRFASAPFSCKEDKPLAGLRVLDIGCGAGLLSEPLARLGAQVTGLETAPLVLQAARKHAKAANLKIQYKSQTAQELAEQAKPFDIVLALEVIEHIPKPHRASFFQAVGKLVSKSGIFFLSTLNRTALSYLLGIIAAERILRWLPKGTHQWSEFVRPEECAKALRAANLSVENIQGMIYAPLAGHWVLSKRTKVNYLLCATPS